MSVIRFAPEEVLALTEFLQEKVVILPELYLFILENKNFTQKSHLMGLAKDNEKIQTFIYWMMDSLYASNLFAYAIQYRENITAEEYHLPNDIKPKKMGDQETVDALGSFDYNLADNGGNRYVEPSYYDIYCVLVNYFKQNQGWKKIKPAGISMRNMRDFDKL